MGDGVATPDTTPDAIDVLRLRWQTAESRLCSLVMADPDLYELGLTLVVEARDFLRSQCATLDELTGIDAAEVLARCPSAAAVRERGLNPAVAFDAARLHRLRELLSNG